MVTAGFALSTLNTLLSLLLKLFTVSFAKKETVYVPSAMLPFDALKFLFPLFCIVTLFNPPFNEYCTVVTFSFVVTLNVTRVPIVEFAGKLIVTPGVVISPIE